MKRIFIFAFVMSVYVFLPAYADSQFYNPIGKGCTNAFYIDKDCDGYGVASPLGVDADDNDPGVNTPETVIAKYGTLENFLHHLGYYPERIFYISANGDDDTGEVNNINKPYKTWSAVNLLLEPGDAVIFRGGVYDYLGNYAIDCSNLNGTRDKPIIFMAYPGEKVILDTLSAGIQVWESNYLTFDGFVSDNTKDIWGNGINMHLANNIIFRNIEAKHHSIGFKAAQDLHNIFTENCVFHDNSQSHGIYWGARDLPNSNLTVRNCIMYRNGRHGFQHNGRVTHLIFENNIIHSNDMGGISLLEGISNSTFRNNLIFNNNKQGIIFGLYDSSYSTILPYDQINNLVANNLIWIGKYYWDGSGTGASDHAAIDFNDDTKAQNSSMDGNIFRNNILVTYNGAAFRIRQKKIIDTATIENNMIYRVGGSDEVMTYGEEDVYD
ncbi:MAG TPA: right-handed parallel beta-helix repeat-containing protein, partial [Candidatus Atribacteria bacterium]|nr:right-handed parallel beta-helix repeat-containing protein [Candidatus Atribacteria bacterium]